jgi:predicted transposase YbfD/YdcC
MVRLKCNQPKLKTTAGETVISSNPTAFHREEKIAGGRLEIRETYLYNRPNNLDEGWESIRLIVYVRREFLRGNREHKTDSFYVSDLKTGDAKPVAEVIRSHRHIENKLHYSKDAIMREDAASAANKTAAANFALLRDFTFNILKTKKQVCQTGYRNFYIS